MKRKNINDIYFGVCTYTNGRVESWNLFQNLRVKESVARYVVMSPEEKARLDSPLRFCFGDVWGRAQYEFVVSPWPPSSLSKTVEDVEKTMEKVDVYQMYVEPNAEYLMELVNSVSLNSAREVRRATKARYKRLREMRK